MERLRAFGIWHLKTAKNMKCWTDWIRAWSEERRFQNSIKSLFKTVPCCCPWATQIRISMISLHDRQGDLEIHILLEEERKRLWGQKQTQFSNVDLTDCFTSLWCSTGWGNQAGPCSSQKTLVWFFFRNPNRVKPGEDEEETEVCTMSRKRRYTQN